MCTAHSPRSRCWDERGVRSAGRIDLTAEALHAFGRQLTQDDDVVLEATCNTHAIARLLRAYVRRVVVSNPLQTRAIAEAKVKTDKIDAAVLVRLHASGFLPEVWSGYSGIVTKWGECVVYRIARCPFCPHGRLRRTEILPPTSCPPRLVAIIDTS